MSREERTGYRDLTYSKWHRSLDDSLTVIDIDWCEYCATCMAPLALIETARYSPGRRKSGVVTRNLAKMAGLPAYTVTFETENDVIVRFHVQIEHAISEVPSGEFVVSPEQWRQHMLKLRTKHDEETHVFHAF